MNADDELLDFQWTFPIVTKICVENFQWGLSEKGKGRENKERRRGNGDATNYWGSFGH